MKRYFLMDAWGVDRLTTQAKTKKQAEKEFYNIFGYLPDVTKEIDDGGGVLKEYIRR